MAEKISFKARVREVAIRYAASYQSYFVEKSYLVLSDAFSNQPYYIIEAQPTNYLHLIGVSTPLTAADFFDKCLNGALSETDFELSFHGRDPKFSKGSIRQKILTLPGIFGILSESSTVEEDYTKNVVRCSFATSDGVCTLGFIATPYARPMTLLRGNELHLENARSFKIIISKPRGETFFSDVVAGSDDDIAAHYDSIKDLLDDKLRKRAEEILLHKEPVSDNDSKE